MVSALFTAGLASISCFWPGRSDRAAEQRRHSFHSSPRKKLQFEGKTTSDLGSASVKPPDGNPQLGWEEPRRGSDLRVSYEDPAPLLDRIHSLAEAEKLFDELTQEKLQVMLHRTHGC